MRGPKPEPLLLAEAERTQLEQLVRRHTTPQQLALRAKIVLAAADGANHAQITRSLGVTLTTARAWRRRWLALQHTTLDDLPVADRLTDAPRSGKPVRITDAHVCRIIELACEAPQHSGRPISQWSARELADEIKARAILSSISPRHAARLLNRGICNPIAGATG